VDVLRASSRRRFNRRAFLTRMVARSCYASPPRKRPKCCPLLFFREMNGLMLVRTILRSELAGNRSFPRFCGSADFSDRRTSVQDLAPKDHGGHMEISRGGSVRRDAQRRRRARGAGPCDHVLCEISRPPISSCSRRVRSRLRGASWCLRTERRPLEKVSLNL
jgi:hypothetical protein